MFTLIRKIINLFLFIIILAVIFHNWTAKTALTFGLRYLLAAPVSVNEVRIDLMNTQVVFQGIEIRNPSGFPKSVLTTINKIFIELDPKPLLQGQLHLKTLEVDIQEWNVVRNREGSVNLLALKIVKESQKNKASGASSKEQSGSAGPSLKLFIDQLVLSMGTARYTDMTSSVPLEKSFNMRMKDEVYRNVDGVEDAVKIVIWESLRRMGVGGISQAMDQIRGDLSGSLGQQDFIQKTLNALKERF